MPALYAKEGHMVPVSSIDSREVAEAAMAHWHYHALSTLHRLQKLEGDLRETYGPDTDHDRSDVLRAIAHESVAEFDFLRQLENWIGCCNESVEAFCMLAAINATALAALLADEADDRLAIAGERPERRRRATRRSGRTSAQRGTGRCARSWSDQIALPPSETLAEEILSHEWELDGSGRILICPKDDVRGRIGRSPDQADVCAMSQSASYRTTMVRGPWPV